MNRDLAFGKSAIAVAFDKDGTSTENQIKVALTAGQSGDISKKDAVWTEFSYGLGREVTIDLGEVYAVNQLELSFLHDVKSGAFSPAQVEFFLSENGEDFYSTSTVAAPYPPSFDMLVRARYKASFGRALRARYVKAVFDVDLQACCDTFKVYGDFCDGFEGGLKGEIAEKHSIKGYAAPMSDGPNDICRVYYGYSEKGEVSQSAVELFPYVAYVDNCGYVSGLMFDSLVFCYNDLSPSGGCYGFNGKETDMSDWEYLLDSLFSFNKNMAALNDVVGDMKKTLGLPVEYKYKIFLTAPVPKVSLSTFGDYNRDGIEDKLITTEDCVNAYLWFVDEATRRFEGLSYPNITIEGWLWNSPTLSPIYRDDEADFAKQCIDGLHSRGYKCLYAPDYQRGAVHKASEFGFDYVIPSAVNQYDSDKYYFLCRKYGLGADAVLSEPAEVGSVLDNLAQNGMMKGTVHLFTPTSHNAVFQWATSENEEARSSYDKLYSFIKGDISVCKEDEPQIEEIPVEIPEEIPVEIPVEDVIEEAPLEIPDLPPLEEIEEVIEEAIEEVIEEVIEEAIEAAVEYVPAEEEIPEEIPEEEIVEEKVTTSEKTETPYFQMETDFSANDSEGIELHITPNDSEDGFTVAEGVSELIIRIDPEKKEQEVCRREVPIKPLPKKHNKKKCSKKIAIGAGVAALVGIAYIIKKLSDKD